MGVGGLRDTRGHLRTTAVLACAAPVTASEGKDSQALNPCALHAARVAATCSRWRLRKSSKRQILASALQTTSYCMAQCFHSAEMFNWQRCRNHAHLQGGWQRGRPPPAVRPQQLPAPHAHSMTAGRAAPHGTCAAGRYGLVTASRLSQFRNLFGRRG